MDELTIRQVIERVLSGNLRVPAFQRGFVWDANRVAYLMDSIYKGYPFGSILLWRTKEKLQHEKQLGPFKLPPGDSDYPVDYILDGQQRITSIFGVFQTDLKPAQGDQFWAKVYFDFTANPDIQESQFLSLNDADFDPKKHFLLNSLFDTVEYRKATAGFDDDLLVKIDGLQAVFKEARIPVQMISTENRTTVAIVFERVNQKGVELDTLQLLSAWTWSEDFDLQIKFDELSKELEPFGFRDISDDKNLLLRCVSAVLSGTVNANNLIQLNGADVRSRFQEIINGIKGAIDFLRRNLHVHSLDNLPSINVIIPLTVFFASSGSSQVRMTNDQKNTILRWFWRSSFMRRYNSQTIAAIQEDITQMSKLKNNSGSTLGEFSWQINDSYFTNNEFRVSSISSKTTILMLAQSQPLSLISGVRIDLGKVLKDYNRNEFHHIFPQAYLKSIGVKNPNVLGNLTFLSRADNNQISSKPPSEYANSMPSERNSILESCMIPSGFEKLSYDEFIAARSNMLAQMAQRLMTRGY